MKKTEIVINNLFKLSLLIFVTILTGCRNNPSIEKKVDFYKNKNLKEINYLENGMLNGASIKLYPNNIIKSFSYYKDNKILVLNTFYDNGQLMVKGKYNNKELEEGEWIYYYSSGKLWKKGVFKDGKKTGIWVRYYENGTIEKKSKFDKNENEKIIIDNQIEEIPE